MKTNTQTNTQKTKQTKLSGKSSKTSWALSLTALILITLTVVFAFIGFFGDVSMTKLTIQQLSDGAWTKTTTKTSVSALDKFFQTGWEIFSADGSFKDKAFTIITFLLHFISYIAVMAGAVAGIVFMANGWYAFDKKLDVQDKIRKGTKVVLIATLGYIVLTMFFSFLSAKSNSTGYKSNGFATFGWGSALVVTAFVFAVITETINMCNSNKINITTTILNRVIALLIIILVIVGFGAVNGTKQGDSLKEYWNICDFNSTLSQPDTPYDFTTSKIFVWVGLVMTIAIITMLMSYIGKNNGKVQIGLSFAMLVLAIVAGVILQQAVKSAYSKMDTPSANKPTALFGWGYIVQIVSYAAIGGLSIANFVILSKTNNSANNKVKAK